MMLLFTRLDPASNSERPQDLIQSFG
jgi:hypothetical protein